MKLWFYLLPLCVILQHHTINMFNTHVVTYVKTIENVLKRLDTLYDLFSSHGCVYIERVRLAITIFI